MALVKLLMMGSGQQQQQQQHNDPAPAAAAAAATLGAPSSHTQCPQAPVQPLVCGGQRAGHAGDCSGARGDLVAGQRRRLVVAAYSYGSCVASRALPQLAPWLDAFAVVGFPMGGYNWVVVVVVKFPIAVSSVKVLGFPKGVRKGQGKRGRLQAPT